MKAPIYLGIDFGYRNPFAALLCCPVRGGEQILVVDEHYQVLRTVGENGRRIIAKNPGVLRKGWADPSRPDSIAELTEVLGIGILPAPSVGVQYGQELVKQWLKNGPNGPGLVIHPRCINLLREIKYYDEHDPGSGDHHALDALRYFLVGWLNK
jgi:hypothetical protein